MLKVEGHATGDLQIAERNADNSTPDRGTKMDRHTKYFYKADKDHSSSSGTSNSLFQVVVSQIRLTVCFVTC